MDEYVDEYIDEYWHVTTTYLNEFTKTHVKQRPSTPSRHWHGL